MMAPDLQERDVEAHDAGVAGESLGNPHWRVRAMKPARILIVDDDDECRRATGALLRRRGYEIATANNARSAFAQAHKVRPTHVLLETHIGNGEGIDVLRTLVATMPEVPVVIVTGFASVPGAVEAIKHGATHYLAKPVALGDIESALGLGPHRRGKTVTLAPLNLRRLEWEHLQRVLAANQGNISASARSLGMHRRTLQRKLAKRPSAG